MYLPQKDWTLRSHTEQKWSLIGHCTIWGRPGNCLRLSHWHPALRGQVQVSLGRGAGLHQPRQHTGEKIKKRKTSWMVRQKWQIFHVQIRKWIIWAILQKNRGTGNLGMTRGTHTFVLWARASRLSDNSRSNSLIWSFWMPLLICHFHVTH